MAIVFRPLTVRGDVVTPGIEVSDQRVVFAPHWGMTRHYGGLYYLAVTVDDDAERNIIDTPVSVRMTDKLPVLYPSEGTPTMELVLLQEYTPGVGAKRWPSFRVELSDERVLAEAQTSGGSGWEKWSLICAPLGWADKVASSFLDYRDVGGQVVIPATGEVRWL